MQFYSLTCRQGKLFRGRSRAILDIFAASSIAIEVCMKRMSVLLGCFFFFYHKHSYNEYPEKEMETIHSTLAIYLLG